MTTRQLLDSDEAMARGAQALAALDPIMARLAGEFGPPPLRKRDPGLAGLAQIVVGQQVSTASAAAIWARCLVELAPLTHDNLRALPDMAFKAAGLSWPKIRTLRAVAEAIGNGSLPLDRLHERDADEAHRLLVAVKGIGPWTADVYLLFCLGHPDAFAAGDLALQEAAKIAAGLEARPSAAALGAMAERWRPWRGIAAGLLWALYARVKSRDGVLAA